MKENISIIGCGWLGLPLAKFFIHLDYKIKGSTTSKSKLNTLSQNGIDAYQIQLNARGITGNIADFLDNSDILIVNVPPGLRANPNKNHVAEISYLIEAVENSSIKKVLYISTTSVFKDEEHFPIITHATNPNNTTKSSKQLIEIEKCLQSNTNFKSTILRFGGLFDGDRHPGKYLSGKENISNAEAPINLIHKKDCIAIIASILNNDMWDLTLNACYPIHPSKKQYYSNYCKQNELPLPNFKIEEKSKGKIINSTKLVQLLNYTFKHAP